jgi:DNA polymerase
MPSAEKTLSQIAADAANCDRCPLYRNATQTVFGRGPAPAPIMLIGEQPGDSEDRAGLPFVGPAGRVLDRALEVAGIDRHAVYVTNAVKHFKNVPRGKRRLHQRPNRYEIDRCRWWLERELELVHPSVAVALGATAASALAGRAVPVAKSRGRLVHFGDRLRGLVTVHPSYILRLRDEPKAEAFRHLVAGLRHAGELAPEALLRVGKASRSVAG